MARTRKSPVSEKPARHLRSFDLTPQAIAALKSLSQDATDYIGRAVSGGAIVRALLRLAQQQDVRWFYEKVCPLVEAEMQQGLRWGREKKG
jgi:hypothetical protein